MDRKLPGFYVEGRYFGNRYAQAQCRARFLADQYRRPVDVTLVDHRGSNELAVTVQPMRVAA